MATVFLLREGPGSNRITVRQEVPVDDVAAFIGARHVRYVGADAPMMPTDRPDLTAYRTPAWVCVRISDQETGFPFDRAGVYLLVDVPPAEVITRWQT